MCVHASVSGLDPFPIPNPQVLYTYFSVTPTTPIAVRLEKLLCLTAWTSLEVPTDIILNSAAVSLEVSEFKRPLCNHFRSETRND
jgi:hypothetical protein